MADLVVIVPSRGRPHVGAELAEACTETCTADTLVCLAVDSDDPTRELYEANPKPSGGLFVAPNRDMVDALNRRAGNFAESPAAPFAIGFMGDDHRPRTKGWDQAYLDALRELGSGVVYGNDLLQGENLPTQFAVTADIVRALKHVAPPPLKHLYVDNYWRDLGTFAGCLRYLPDVVVEHVHPVAGKAEWDDGYRRVNAPGMYAADEAAYRRYCAERMPADIAVVRALRGAA